MAKSQAVGCDKEVRGVPYQYHFLSIQLDITGAINTRKGCRCFQRAQLWRKVLVESRP